ncbi:hypothetical protein F5887DRAFT_1084336 [Amanita rubescens]|nr:hypothetical protein F5887DRAFT_1084336 [Amanita rubescens]
MPTPFSSLSSPASDAPASDALASASPSEIPLRRFSKEEGDFLKGLLPAFNEYLNKLDEKGTGSHGVKGVKGKQLDWIKTYALNPFIEKFNVNDENSSMLLLQIKKWFWNHGRHARKPEVKIIHVPSMPTRRRTTARERFGNAFNDEINEKVKVKHEKINATTQMNLPFYHEILNDMYDNANEDTRAMFEEEAKTFNSKIGDPPAQSEIYVLKIVIDRSQKNITTNIAIALKRLCGWDWGGHGDTVFFVLGAYRDQDSEINTFNSTISSEDHVESFKTHIPNIEASLWDHFTSFAATALPIKANGTGTTGGPSTSDDPAESDIQIDEDITNIPTPLVPDNLDDVATVAL